MGIKISVEEGISGVSILVDDESKTVLANDPFYKITNIFTGFTILVIVYNPYRLVEQRDNKYYNIIVKEVPGGYEYLIGPGTYVIRK